MVSNRRLGIRQRGLSMPSDVREASAGRRRLEWLQACALHGTSNFRTIDQLAPESHGVRQLRAVRSVGDHRA